jgi:hypothetical protein
VKEALRILEDLAALGDREIAASMRAPLTESHQFDNRMLLRAVNALKATQILLDAGHWEIACGAVRQIFELLVNVEYLINQDDRELARLRFTNYGILQRALARKKDLEYEKTTGRTADQSKLDLITELLETPEMQAFWTPVRGKGRAGWLKSWSGLSVWDLANKSDQPIRKHQYQQLFSRWSEEAHGAPGAVIMPTFRGVGDEWVQEMVISDERESTGLVIIAVSLFAELWFRLPDAPRAPTEIMDLIQNRMNRLLGRASDEERTPQDA